ncbi:MAG: hypothetical protein [Podoviridae sp. ctLUJ1]|nr:MAG: hypothetical protein [Podoviridae sp. ctLUJ1]
MAKVAKRMVIEEIEVRKAIPRELQARVTPEFMEKLNQAVSDPHTAEMMRDNIFGYLNVLQEGKFKLEGYIDAVRYVSYKSMGDSNIRAYVKTFPDKYNNFVNSGVTEKDIATYVSAYNKSKLVNLIYEQSLVPVWLINAENYQKAINVQVSLMMDTNISPKVRSDAANSLLTHLKRPEAAKVQLSVEVKESDAMRELRELTSQFASQQHQSIINGEGSAKGVAEQKIIQAEYEEIDEE